MAKASTHTSRAFDKKYLGPEPSYDGSVIEGLKMITTLNWYNHFMDKEDAKEYLSEFCKTRKIKINVSNHKNNVYGWLARIVNKGGTLNDNDNNKLFAYIETLKKKIVERIDNDSQVVVSDRQRLGQWLPDFEEAIDNFNEPFDSYGYIRANNIPQMYIKMISEHYQPLLEELQCAYIKGDPQVTEAFRGYSRTDLKAYCIRVKTIIDDCDKYVGNVRKERKPRKKKTKSTESILKNFKYCKADDSMKLSSEDPAKILGAEALYVLNSKQKTLTMFIAKDSTGLNINRTSITNYDEKQSITKKIGRSLETITKQIIGGTKRTRLKVLGSVKTNPSNFTDRLNENSIILRVDK